VTVEHTTGHLARFQSEILYTWYLAIWHTNYVVLLPGSDWRWSHHRKS